MSNSPLSAEGLLRSHAELWQLMGKYARSHTIKSPPLLILQGFPFEASLALVCLWRPNLSLQMYLSYEQSALHNRKAGETLFSNSAFSTEKASIKTKSLNLSNQILIKMHSRNWKLTLLPCKTNSLALEYLSSLEISSSCPVYTLPHQLSPLYRVNI